MIVSHSHRFVVLLPWKTASQTTLARLAPYDDQVYPRFYYVNPYLGRITHQHITYGEYAALPEKSLGYFEAAFTRNPYDRVYAAFRQLQTDLVEQPGAAYPSQDVRDVVMAQLAENRRQLESADYDFDRWVLSIRDEQVVDVERNSSFPLYPGHYWTHQSGTPAVDFVGRVERFELDFQSLVDAVGLRDVEHTNANVVDLVGESHGNPFAYRYVDRMSCEAISRINDLFDDDFELLGYSRVEPGAVAKKQGDL